VTFLDAYGGRLLRSLRIMEGPRFVAITHIGQRAYVTCERSDRVYILEVASRRILRSVPVGKGLSGVAVAPDDRFVYLAGTVGQKIYVLDPRVDRIIGSIPAEGVGPVTHLTVSGDGRFLYATGTKDAVLKIDLVAAQVVKRAAVGSSPIGLALTPDDRYLCVANAGANTLSIVDLEQFTELQTVEVGPQPTDVAVGGDGTIYVANSAAEAVSAVLFQPPQTPKKSTSESPPH